MESIKHTYPGGTVEYMNEHNQLHREDGPAFIYPGGTKEEYWLYGNLHREDGPAVIDSDGSKEWFINGIEYPYEDWLKRVKSTKEVNIIDFLVENNIDFCKSDNTITIKLK